VAAESGMEEWRSSDDDPAARHATAHGRTSRNRPFA
jgi:hypothetical protein